MVTCHLHFWQNDWDLLRATVVTWRWNRYLKKESAQKADPGEENSAAPQTNCTITGPAFYHQDIPAPCPSTNFCFLTATSYFLFLCVIHSLWILKGFFCMHPVYIHAKSFISKSTVCWMTQRQCSSRKILSKFTNCTQMPKPSMLPTVWCRKATWKHTTPFPQILRAGLASGKAVGW